jgi:hypothetical protein
MKRVFLHVGKHKTGTTSIQKFLAFHRETLLRHGFRPVSNDEVRTSLGMGYRRANQMNNATMAHVLIRPNLQTPLRLLDGDPFLNHDRRKMVNALNALLGGIPQPNLIVSAEAFSFLRTGEEKSLYEALFAGFAVVPLLFLREKQAWIESWKRQTRSLLDRIQPASGDPGVLDYSEDTWLCDDRAIAEFFDDPQVLHYEMLVRRYGSVIPPFLECLGLPTGAFERIDFFANPSVKTPPSDGATPPHPPGVGV